MRGKEGILQQSHPSAHLRHCSQEKAVDSCAGEFGRVEQQLQQHRLIERE